MELAELVPKGAKLGDAVFERLSPRDKADVARSLIDNLLPSQLDSLSKTSNGKAMLRHAAGLLDGRTTNRNDLGASATGDVNRQQRIARAFGLPPVQQKSETQKVKTAVNNSGFRGINEEQLVKIAPALKKDPVKLRLYTELLNSTMKESGINTPAQQAAFIATCSAETIGFRAMTEGKSEFASSRLKYKGRGIIQLTDKSASNPTNYLGASQYLKLGSPDTKPPYKLLVEQPELAAKPEYSFKIAGWYWAQREHKTGIPNNIVGEQPKPDLQDFRQASSLVNSGRPMGRVNHWGDRLVHYKNTLSALNIPISPEMSANIQTDIANHIGKGKQHWLNPGEKN